MTNETAALLARLKATEANRGLTVRTMTAGRTGDRTFADAAARDEYMDRARRDGALVWVVTGIAA